MAKADSGVLNIVVWLTGILVSLAVGFGMIYNTLTIPILPTIVTQIAGWIVVIGAIVSLIMALFNR
ncbi:MAG: hypothetical protein Q7S33_05315 [Nanoarchaeota archaeon]|nr:hypothetical protein [Nanoarchaeota archaeon]